MRNRIPIAIGAGIDRASGLVVVNPASASDSRNVYGRDGKIALTPGMSLTGFPPLEWGTHIVKAFGMESTLDILLIVFDAESRALRMYRVDTANSVLQLVEGPAGADDWGVLGGDVEFPVIMADEAEGKVGFAHAEVEIGSRLVTIVYTPDVDPDVVGSWAPLQADLDGEGLADVYFSGLIAHLLYIVGWGFGSDSDPDRGDILRISNPDSPWTFVGENYSPVGVRGDPVLTAVPVTGALSAVGGASSVLALGKSNRAFRLVGSSFDDFVVEVLDPKHGVIGAACALATGGPSFWWSDDGCRLVTPLGTKPIAQPLELISPLPNDFPTLGPGRLCFTHFDKQRRLAEWYFPDVEAGSVPVPGFSLSLWNEDDPRWSFRERQQPVVCAGYQITRETGSPPNPPAGYVSDIVIADSGIAGDSRFRSVGLTWDNNAAVGTETVQLFARVLDGEWEIVGSTPVSGDAQSLTWVTALPVASYEVALRYVNGRTAGVGYTGLDPDDWTAPTAPGAMAAVITSSAIPSDLVGAFSQSTLKVALSWLCAQLEVPFLLEKNAGAGWVTVAAGITALAYEYTPVTAELNTTVDFRVSAARAAVVGSASNTASVACTMLLSTPVLGAVSAGPSFIGPGQTWRLSAFLHTASTGPLIGYEVEWKFNGAVVRNANVPTCPGGDVAFVDVYTTGLSYPAGQGITALIRIRARDGAGTFSLWSANGTVSF